MSRIAKNPITVPSGVEVNVAAPRRAEIPPAPRVTEREVAREYAAVAVERGRGVLDVAVIDPVGEAVDKASRIDPLPDQM